MIVRLTLSGLTTIEGACEAPLPCCPVETNPLPGLPPPGVCCCCCVGCCGADCLPDEEEEDEEDLPLGCDC